MSRAYIPLRGFLLHDSRINPDAIDADKSSYTQQGSRPGVAVADDPLARYRPHAHNAQPADLDLIALRGGLPVTVRGSGFLQAEGAGLGYRVSGEADELYRGWNEPNLVTGYRPALWSTTNNWSKADAVTCPRSGKVVVVAADATATDGIRCTVWQPLTRLWGAPIDFGVPSHSLCCVCVLRSGRVLSAQAAPGGALTLQYSDDDGGSWEEYTASTLASGLIDGAVDSIRMEQDAHGNLILLAHDEALGTYYQFASADDGQTFELIDSGTAPIRSFCVRRSAQGRLIVAYIDSGDDVQVSTIADAFDPISDATFVLTVASVQTAEITVDSDGIAYLVASMLTSDVVRVYRSIDHGGDFDPYEDHAIQLGGGVAGATGHRHRVRALASSGGELLALCNPDHTGAPSTDRSLIGLQLGGWSNLEHHQSSTTPTRDQRAAFGDDDDTDANWMFLPTELLVNQGWTHTGTAATLSSGYHRYNPAAATAYDELVTAGNIAGACTVLLEMQVVSGGSVSTDACSFQHMRRNGVTRSILTIRASTTQVRVRDESGAGTNLATADIGMSAAPVQFAVIYKNDGLSVSVFYKTRASSTWTLLVAATLGTDATATATDRYQVGCRASTTSDMRVGPLGVMDDDWLGGLEIIDPTKVERMRWGKNLSALPYPVRDQVDADSHMAHLSGTDGSARFYETWSVPAIWDHGARAAHPVEVPRPGQPWRTTDDGAEVILAWDLGADGRLGGGQLAALALLRANFRTAYLEVATAAAPSTWVELGAYDARVVASGSYTLEGNILRPTSSTTRGARFFGDSDLRGGVVTLDVGGTPELRRIARNTGGGWVGSGLQTEIEIELQGGETTSGTCHVDAPSGVLVCGSKAPSTYRYVRLRIPAQTTPEGYFELGQLCIGAVHVIGRQWSRGWSMRWVPITRDDEDESGTVYVEPLSSDEELCYRREITVAWQDGHGDVALRQTEPHWLAASNGAPLVAEHDVHRALLGLLKRSKGGKVPSVALLEVPQHSTTVHDPTLFSFGRLGVGQALQLNNVQGSEGRDEIGRVESLTHVELP